MRLISAFKRWWGNIFSKQNVQEVFSIQSLAISDLMLAKQEMYRQIVRGAAPWNDSDTPSLMIAGTISADIASKVIVGLKSDIFGGEIVIQSNDGKPRKEKTMNTRSEYLNEQYLKVKEKLKEAVIAACNGGEVIFKPHMTDMGLDVSVSETECYFPAAYNDRNELVDVVFISSIKRDKWIYRLLERQTYNEKGKTHTVSYRAFKSQQEAYRITPDNIGKEVPLSEIPEWSDFTDITFVNIDKPLFALFKIPSSDRVETPQRQGLPVWSKAIEKFKEADIQNQYIRREYYLGKSRILASHDLFGVMEHSEEESKPRKPSNVSPLQFNPDDRDIFVKLNDSPENVQITPFTPELRFDSLNAEMNRIKRDIEFLCGLSYGILSDAQVQEKTATEVMASKDRFFTTVSGIQEALEKALRHLLESLDKLSDLQQIPRDHWDVSFTWDDSIMADRQREFDERVRLLQLGVIYREELKAWYFGLDEDSEEARNLPELMESEW